MVNFSCFFGKNGQKRLKSKNNFFVAFSFVGKHLNTKFQKISPNGLGLANFHNFLSILAVFLVKKRPKRAKIQKKFFYSILLRSIYKPDFRKFHQTVRILPIFFILVNFGCFLVKKRPKKAEIQKKFFWSILFCWEAYTLRSIYIPNFRKFHQTVWILPIYLIFGQFGCFLVKKRPK